MASPRIIFVNRFYWPESPATGQLLTDLSESLANTDFSVAVLTSGLRTSPAYEVRNRVQILRLVRPLRGSRSLSGRAVDFIAFVRATRRWLKLNLQKGDVLVTMTDPPMLGPVVDQIAQRRGVRHLHWIQDIFPEVAATVFNFPLLNRLRGWRDRAWKTAAGCVVPGRQMGDLVARRGVPAARIVCVPNWAPAGLAPASSSAWRKQFSLTENFIVMYSGNLGRVHDFSALVPLARRLQNEQDVVFVFVGHGPQLEPLQAEAAAANLHNIRFFPPVTRSGLAETLSAGDLHLVTLRPGCEALVFPSKLYGIAAVGRPALVIGPRDCDLAREVAAHAWGEGFVPTDIESIAKSILNLRDDSAERERRQVNALAYAASHSLATAVACWRQILRPLVLAEGPVQAPVSTAHR